MRKPIANTKVSVKLRKSEDFEGWYLYLECYPVFENGKAKRVREYLNRTITTPLWDKSRTARTTADSKTYKPKRDINGIIQCKSETDQEACIYADDVRKLRQKEYDNLIYTATQKSSRANRTNVCSATSLNISKRQPQNATATAQNQLS